MKVYIVTTGEYSSYSIEAVFTDEKQAELFCAVHSKDYWIYDYEVWETDETRIDASVPVMNRWFASVRKDGTVAYMRKYKTIANSGDDIIDYTSCYHIIVTLDESINENQAKKIILDKLAAFKYRRLIEAEE